MSKTGSGNSPSGLKRTKAVFVDRDGVINASPGKGEYVKTLEEFRILPNAVQALQSLHRAGYPLYIISNQAGVSKGLYTRDDLRRMDGKLEAALGFPLDGIYYCTHRTEEQCPCRKPKAGMIFAARDDARAHGLDIDLAGSFFIGDTLRDVATGNAAGVSTILVLSGHEGMEGAGSWDPAPGHVAEDLNAAAALILSSKKDT